MRKILLIIAGLLVLLAISVSPAEGHTGVGCATVEFEWVGTTPLLTSVTADESVRVAAVGYFLNIQYSADASDVENLTSVDMTGLASPLTVCTDWIETGTVVATPTIYVPVYAIELIADSDLAYITPFGHVLR